MHCLLLLRLFLLDCPLLLDLELVKGAGQAVEGETAKDKGIGKNTRYSISIA